jgi:hypothetical protein
MKKLLLISFCLALFATTGWSQNVPVSVKATFESLYPGAQSVKWEKDGYYYEAEFTLDGDEMEAVFDATGGFIESEMEINVDELPAAVRNSLSENFGDWDVEEADMIKTADGEKVFEVELENGRKTIEIRMDENGNKIGQEDEDDDDDDGEEDDDDN